MSEKTGYFQIIHNIDDKIRYFYAQNLFFSSKPPFLLMFCKRSDFNVDAGVLFCVLYTQIMFSDVVVPLSWFFCVHVSVLVDVHVQALEFC